MQKRRKNIMVVSFQSLSANSGAGMARLGYYLSNELDKRGLLQKFIVHSKGKYDTPFKSEPVSFTSRLYLKVLNTANKLLHFAPHKFRFLQERIFDWFCRFKINKNTDLLFVTHPFLKKTFKKAKALGITVVLLSGTPEENYIYEIVSEENKKLGITSIDAYTYPRRLHYFNESVVHVDKVIGSLPPAYQSYKNSKTFKGEVVNLTGHMLPDFKQVIIAAKNTTKETFTVGYIAHTVVLKGLHYLLEAWEEFTAELEDTNVELHIVGGMHPAMKAYIDDRFRGIKQVKFLGSKDSKGVESFLQSIDLFVVPSLVDGAPITALEAAHYAVPVVITDNSGSCELLSRGSNSCQVIPIRNVNAIKESISWAYHHKAENIEMGARGKQALDDYKFNDFMVALADVLEGEISKA